EDGIRDDLVTGVQTCALPIYSIELHKPARVKGDLAAPALSIEKGVVFEGKSMMLNGGINLVSLSGRDSAPKARGRAKDQDLRGRSEERRVGEGGGGGMGAEQG